MPRTVPFEKKLVSLTGNCAEILEIFSTTLNKAEISPEEKERILASVKTTEEKISKGKVNKVKGLVESVLDIRIGASETELPKCSLQMDTGSYALYQGYERFWVAQMRMLQGIETSEMELEKIDSGLVLIMELYLRLVAQALRLDSPLKADQNRRLFINLLLDFGRNLSENNKLKNLEENLFSKHKEWLTLLAEAADKIDDMNKVSPVLRGNLEYLEKTKNDILRYLIVILDQKLKTKRKWEGALADRQLSYTLSEQESKILAELRLETAITANEEEMSVVLTSDNNEILESNVKQCNLVASGLLTIENARQQKNIINAFLGTKLHSLIEVLYALLNANDAVYRFLSQVDNLAIQTGWLLFLFPVLDLSQVDTTINTHLFLCKTAFKRCESVSENFFKTSLGRQLGQYTHSELKRGSLPSLSQLQNIVLLRSVFEEIKQNFESLADLGALLGCQVTCNPFLRKTVKSRAESQHIVYESEKFVITAKPVTEIKLLTGATTEQTKNPPAAPPFTKKYVENSSAPVTRTNSPTLPRQYSMFTNPEAEAQISPFFSSFPNLSQPLSSSQPPSFKEEVVVGKSNRKKTVVVKPNKPTFYSHDDEQLMDGLSKKQTQVAATGLSVVVTATSSEMPVEKERVIEKPLKSSSDLATTQSQPIVAQISVSAPAVKMANEEKVIEKTPSIKQEREVKPLAQEMVKESEVFVRPLIVNSTVKQNQSVTIEMPSIQDMPSEKIVKREKEVKKEEGKKRLYPANLPYIEAIVHRLNLTAAEVAQASETFNTNKNYFKQEGFSPFRLAVVKVIKDFHEHYMSPNEPESLLDDTEIWRQRWEEIRILRYFCIGPIDDSRLLIFIGAMIASATIALFPTKLKYNYLVNELEKILKSHYNGDKRFEAYLQPDINAALLAETEKLRQTAYEVDEKNTQLTQDLEKSKREAAQLQKDYQELQKQYVSSMKNLTNKVEQLQGDVEAQKRRHEADIQNLKTEFGPFFQKPGAKQNVPEPLPSAQQKSISCNIL